MKKSELKKLIKESVLKLRRESVNDELNSVKGDSIDNQIKKAEALLKILKSEGLAYRALGKEAMAQYKEHDYEKLKAEADKFEGKAQASEKKYKDVEIHLKKLQTEKSQAKKK